MSIKVMTYVWEHSRHKGSELLTLLAIADFAHDDGTNAYPSVNALAQKTRMTARNVQLVLKKLEDSNELQIERNAGPHGCHLFRIPMNICMGEKISGDEKISPVKGEKISGGVKSLHLKNSTGGVKPASPNPLLDPSEEKDSPPIVPPRGKLRPAKVVPTTWVLTSELRLWAKEEVPGVNIEYETAKFRDWEFKTAHTDWNKAWRAWMRRAWEQLPAVQQHGPSSQPFKVVL